AALVESEERTVERFERQKARKTQAAICETLLPLLAEFMRDRKSRCPSKGLRSVIYCLAPEELALAALSPLLHGIAKGRRKRDKSPAMNFKRIMGRALHDKCFMKWLLKNNRPAYTKVTKANNKSLAAWKYRQHYPQWSNEQCVRAGNWLVACVLKALPLYFALEHDGVPCMTLVGKEFKRQLYAELPYLDPAFQPATESLEDWADWREGGYWDSTTRISTTFVRDSHPASVAAFRRAFHDESMKAHVAGVNSIQRVPYAINAAMLHVVERVVGKVGKKKVNEFLVAQDIATAKYIGAETFYVPMNCDKRGRVYGVPHFNFAREDYVRSLFRFARGMPIGQAGDENWIKLHLANCADGIDGATGLSKRDSYKRIEWIENNRSMIVRTAENPESAVDWWRNADAPFSFIAGCMELAGITYSSFITHLPICFDGSCSGIQHLAMMMRDEDAGRLVNLVPEDLAPEVYQSWKDGTDDWLYGNLNPGTP